MISPSHESETTTARFQLFASWKAAGLLCVFAAITLLFVSYDAAHAQNYERLRTEVQQQQKEARDNIEFLRNQIARIESRVSETATEYNQLYRQFEEAERELSLRNQIVSELEEESRNIQRELSIIQESYDEYAEDLERLISNYKDFMRQVYKQGNQSEVMLLVTSSSLNQAQTRRFYLRKFSEYRETQAEAIQEAQEQLLVKEEEMKVAKERNDQVLAESRRERNQMESRRRQQAETIAKLQEDRRSLEAQLEQSRQEIDNLSNLFNELIAEEERLRRAEEERFRQLEAERQRRLAEAQQIEDASEREQQIARYSEPVRRTNSAMFSPDELTLISESFRGSRGQLPWPTSEGAISRKFGNFIHPVHRTSISNPGIHISTEARSQVRAVHDGYVIEVMAIMGFDDAVFISHGDYYTAYANLTEINVRKNTRVRAGDVIGLSGDDDSTNGTAVVFFVRDGNRYVDPEPWITNRPRPIP